MYLVALNKLPLMRLILQTALMSVKRGVIKELWKAPVSKQMSDEYHPSYKVFLNLHKVLKIYQQWHTVPEEFKTKK